MTRTHPRVRNGLFAVFAAAVFAGGLALLTLEATRTAGAAPARDPSPPAWTAAVCESR